MLPFTPHSGTFVVRICPQMCSQTSSLEPAPRRQRGGHKRQTEPATSHNPVKPSKDIGRRKHTLTLYVVERSTSSSLPRSARAEEEESYPTSVGTQGSGTEGSARKGQQKTTKRNKKACRPFGPRPFHTSRTVRKGLGPKGPQEKDNKKQQESLQTLRPQTFPCQPNGTQGSGAEGSARKGQQKATTNNKKA